MSRDPETERVWVAPGNDGMALEFERLPVPECDGPALVEAARRLAITLVVIGPEAPLAAGVADHLVTAGVRTFGATRDAARLESSKWLAKRVMQEAGVPTARAEAFTTVEDATAALDRSGRRRWSRPTDWRRARACASPRRGPRRALSQ